MCILLNRTRQTHFDVRFVATFDRIETVEILFGNSLIAVTTVLLLSQSAESSSFQQRRKYQWLQVQLVAHCDRLIY
jgi:hypothetical protein